MFDENGPGPWPAYGIRRATRSPRAAATSIVGRPEALGAKDRSPILTSFGRLCESYGPFHRTQAREGEPSHTEARSRDD